MKGFVAELNPRWATGAPCHGSLASEELSGCTSEISAQAKQRDTLAHQLPPGTGHGHHKGPDSSAPSGPTLEPQRSCRAEREEDEAQGMVRHYWAVPGWCWPEPSLDWSSAWCLQLELSRGFWKPLGGGWHGPKCNWRVVTVICGLVHFVIISCPGPRLQISSRETPCSSPGLDKAIVFWWVSILCVSRALLEVCS